MYHLVRNGIRAFARNWAQKPTPFYLRYRITDRCNARCKMCNFWRESPHKELKTEQVKETLNILSRMGVGSAVFLGGEPLLRADLVEILAHAKEKCNMTCGFATNGFFLAEKAPELRPYVSLIAVSLDSTIPEEHNSIRGVKIFDQAIQGIQAARQQGIPITINQCVFKNTLSQMERLADLARLLGCTFSAFPVIKASRPEVGDLCQIDDEFLDMDQWYKVSMNLKKTHSNFIITKDMLNWVYAGGFASPSSIRCRTASTCICLNCEGNIELPCIRFPKLRIPYTDLERAWNSPTVREIQKKCGFYKLCQDCLMNCHYEASFLFHPGKQIEYMVKLLNQIRNQKH
ncbi:MAG: radical SAM protein [Promethearchaeota archaeon CR_4]|nr:MAG: radical SAM protein [Candidatus Lokiarchaeota archaeon CR_4]